MYSTLLSTWSYHHQLTNLTRKLVVNLHIILDLEGWSCAPHPLQKDATSCVVVGWSLRCTLGCVVHLESGAVGCQDQVLSLGLGWPHLLQGRWRAGWGVPQTAGCGRSTPDTPLPWRGRCPRTPGGGCLRRRNPSESLWRCCHACGSRSKTGGHWHELVSLPSWSTLLSLSSETSSWVIRACSKQHHHLHHSR